MTDIEPYPCEDCGDDIPEGEGCACDGHYYCASCFVMWCSACAASLKDDYAAELAMERGR